MSSADLIRNYLGLFLLWVLPASVFLGVVGLMVMTDLRRRERTHLFFHILKQAVQDGVPPIRLIEQLAATRDRSIGPHFHLAASWIQSGAPLGFALAEGSRMLPVTAGRLLQAGGEHGEFGKAVMAAAEVSSVTESPARSGQLYFVVYSLATNAALLLLTWGHHVFIHPKFKQMLADMSEVDWLTLAWHAMPPPWLLWTLASVMALIYALLILQYFRLWDRLQGVKWIGRQLSRLELLMPWRRGLMERDFAVGLALFLDIGLPEVAAVGEAGKSIPNPICQKRILSIRGRLENGAPLVEALGTVDRSGHLGWLVRTAQNSKLTISEVVRSWGETLRLRAERQEEYFVRVCCCLLLAITGFFVGAEANLTFGMIRAIISVADM